MSGRGLAQRAFWVLAAIASVLLVAFLVVVVSMTGQLSSLRGQEAAANARLAEVQAAIKAVKMESLRERNRELDDQLSVLELRLAQRAYVPTLLKQIEAEALRTNNDVSETRPGELRKGKLITRGGGADSTSSSDSSDEEKDITGQRYDELDIQLQFRGSYHSAFALLKAIGAFRKMLFVKQVNLQRAGDATRPDGFAETNIDFDVTCVILEPAGGFPGRLVATVYD